MLALEYFLQVDVGAACAAIHLDRDRCRRLYPDLEGRLNRVGYDLMLRGLLPDSLHTFRLNADRDSHVLFTCMGNLRRRRKQRVIERRVDDDLSLIHI